MSSAVDRHNPGAQLVSYGAAIPSAISASPGDNRAVIFKGCVGFATLEDLDYS